MRWLDNPVQDSIWVSHEAVRKRWIKGEFKRFQYSRNGVLCYVYCPSYNVFLSLFMSWFNAGGTQWRYSIVQANDGEAMALEDIIMDEPPGKSHFPKLLIHSQYGEYIQ